MIAALTPIQENIVEERIGIRDFSSLRPFWFLELPDRDTSPLVYVRPCNGHHLIFAEIMVRTSLLICKYHLYVVDNYPVCVRK